MDSRMVVLVLIALWVGTYVVAETYVRRAHQRDAARIARARRGVPQPRQEVTRPDDRPQERHDPRVMNLW